MEQLNTLPTLEKKHLPSLACQFGALGAIDFYLFEKTLTQLEERQKKALLRGWIALRAMPRDAGQESEHLLKIICTLRDSWLSEKKHNAQFSRADEC